MTEPPSNPPSNPQSSQASLQSPQSLPPESPSYPAAPPVPPETAPPTAMLTERTSGVVRAGGVMAAGTLVSRLTGFIAKAVLLAFLGLWVVNDAYTLANTLPNIIFELLIGGVLTSVAIPLLSRARNDPDGGVAYTQRLMTLAIVSLAIATAAALASAPLLIRLYQLFSETASPTMATQFSYLLLPQIFFYGLAALFGAILNTKERFAAPAWAPVINNLVVIAVGVLLFVTAGSFTAPQHGMAELSRGQFLLLGVGTTVGIVLQAAALLPALRRSGFRFRWRWGLDSRMAEAGRLMAWAIAYALISQIGYVITVNVAQASRDGFYALYTYGSMLFQLPYGILGVSLLTAIMPRMSRHAGDGDMRAVKDDMGLANRLSTVALLPVTAAMIALAVPLTIVTARYGKVTESDAHILAFTLAAFAIGLLPLAITLVQMRVFYAMKDGRTPAIINAIMVGVRIPLLLACLLLPEQWVMPALAAAMSVSYVIGVAVGEIWLSARFGRMGFVTTLSTIGRTAVASAAGGLAAWWVAIKLLPVDTTSFGGAVLALVVGGLVGLIIVVGGLLLLRVHEVDVLRRKLLSRRASGRQLSDKAADDTVLEDPALEDPAPPEAAAVDAAHAEAAPMRAPTGGSELRPRGEHRASEKWDDSLNDPSEGPDDPSDFPHSNQAPEHAQEQGQASVTDQHDDGSEARAEPSHRPGAVIGERYRLSRIVVTDTAGNEFWQARDTVLPRDMAVTIIPRSDPSSGTVTRTLRVGRLRHAGLPQTLDMGEAGTSAYVAGQWVEGATLTDLLSDGPLEPQIATRLINEISLAIAEVHRAGIALGAIHPAQVRVNFDGQVRLSHVVARSGATPYDDLRALGALLYLMLTGTWPLDAAAGPADTPAAVRKNGRLLAATKAHPGVPTELSRTADTALRAGEARGCADIDDFIASLPQASPDSTNATTGDNDGSGRGADDGGTGTGGGGKGAAGKGAAGGRTRKQRAPRRARGRLAAAAPAERELIKERRIKLSIAGGMLVVLAALIVIMGSSITKQFLAGVVEPIHASDNQALISAVTPTTTRTVGTTEAPTSSDSDSEDDGEGDSDETTSTTTKTSSSATAKPIAITDAAVYDPQGDGQKDYESYVDLAFDDDTGTVWQTWVYDQQFGPGGIKDGVGLLLSFDHAITPSSVTVSTTTPGTDVQILSTDSDKPKPDDTTVLASATLDDDPVSITVEKAPKSTHLIVWLTKIAPYQGDTAANQGKFQSSISEISIAGS